MIALSVVIIIATIIMWLVVKPHTELLGSWVLTEEPMQNVETTSVLYFYGYDNFKYDLFVNLDHTGNDKTDEARGKYTIDTKNKKIKLIFEKCNTIEVSYTDTDKIQLVSDKNVEYTFVSNKTSKALEEVFKERDEFIKNAKKAI